MEKIQNPSQQHDDIKAMLDEVQMTQSPGYQRGRDDAIQEFISKTHDEALNRVVDIAERYFTVLTKVKGVSPKSYQIGMDQGTRAPAIAVILKKENESLLPELMELAREVEVLLWEETSIDFTIWTFVDDHLDTNRLARDYPFIRKMA